MPYDISQAADRRAQTAGNGSATQPAAEPEGNSPARGAQTAERAQRAADPVMRIAVIGLFVIAVFYTLYFVAPVLVPITIAILLSMLLSPAVEWLERLALPRAIASAIIVMRLSA
jgi:hypothetical protein